MASLFSNLPPPSAQVRTKDDVDLSGLRRDDRQVDHEPGDNRGGDADDSGNQTDDDGPSPKRVKFDCEVKDVGPSSSASHVQQAHPPGKVVMSEEQVLAALQKLKAHISNPSKFGKVSALLRQVIESGAVGASRRQVRDEAFLVVREAFHDFAACTKADVQRDYMRLCHCLDKFQDIIFTAPQKAQLKVYYIMGMIANQLKTDDSFQFNRVLAKVKEMVDELPEAGEEEEALLQELMPAALIGRSADADEAVTCMSSAPDAPEVKAEFDPFGLDSLFSDTGQKPSAKPSVAWSSQQCLVMRRQALIQVLLTAKAYHKLPWARVSVEVLVEHYTKRAAAFTPCQARHITELGAFVRASRHARAQGPSQKEINRDSTSFERARAAWAKADVSARTKVGAQGDTKAQNWLG